MNTRKIQLSKAAIALSERSQDSKARSRIQSDEAWGARLIRKSELQMKAGLRLLRWAEDCR